MPRPKGFHHSNETRAKIRATNLGQKRSDETRERLRQSHLGKSLSEAAKAKLRDLGGERNHNWKGDEITYSAAHIRARKRWSDRPCIGCGNARTQIALRHDASIILERKGRRYSPRPVDYIPLCATCHNAYDRAVRPDYVETQARIRAIIAALPER